MHETVLSLKTKFDHGFTSVVVRYKNCVAIAEFVCGPTVEDFQSYVWVPVDAQEAEEFADEFDTEVRLTEAANHDDRFYPTEGDALLAAFRFIDALDQ